MDIAILSNKDSDFLKFLRGLSIFIIVFGHVGGFWIFRPYSEFLHVFVAVFFFISGATSYLSYVRSKSLGHYYIKRLSGLLAPYYLLCLLTLIALVFTDGHFPHIFPLTNLVKWLLLIPTQDIAPFSSYPLGHLWFLHTLLLITIISPIYFYLQRQNKWMLLFLMLFLIIFSGTQLFIDVGSLLYLYGNNLYKPLIHSIFFILGSLVFFSISEFGYPKLMFCILGCLTGSFLLAWALDLNPDYGFHTYSPDLYYVLGCLAAILTFLFFKNSIVFFINNNRVFNYFFRFLHVHTFSIYLLHGFSIWLYWTLFGNEPQRDNIVLFGIIRIFFVFIITSLLSVPFTFLHTNLVKYISSKSR